MTSAESRKQGFEIWLERFAENPSPYPTVDEYLEAVTSRYKTTNENLPPGISELRNLWRGLIGINPGQIAIVLGEQSAGLNEPPLVLGKRLVATAISKENPAIKIVDFRAQSDVVGSEPGLRRIVLPNPHQPDGIETVNILSGKQYQDSPTSRVPALELDLQRLSTTLAKIYGRRNPNLGMLEAWFDRVGEFKNVAEFQDYLLENLVGQLVEIIPRRFIDYQLETEIFIKGGYGLIMELWPILLELVNKAQDEHNIRNLRVPNQDEAPFYIIFHDDPSSGEITPSKKPKMIPRGRVLMEERDGKRIFHWCESPHARIVSASMSEEDIFDQIYRGLISVVFRTIPRAVILSLIFDGHITGGGALYNIEIAEIFPQIFNGIPHYPITYMTPRNKFNEGIFRYNSYPLRKTGAPHIHEALNAVIRNAVSLYDMILSIDPVEASQLIREVINIKKGNFPFNLRLDLTKSSYY